MSEVALGQLIWFVVGIAFGAAMTWYWLSWFKAAAKQEAAAVTPVPIQEEERPREQPKVLITVDWGVINSALAGSGYVAVPKDSFTSH